MPQQEPLPSDQLAVSTGLWARFVDNHSVHNGAWIEACRNGQFVGSCVCGDYLVPVRPLHVGARIDYEATCRAGCGVIVCAPGGRLGKTRGGE